MRLLRDANAFNNEGNGGNNEMFIMALSHLSEHFISRQELSTLTFNASFWRRVPLTISPKGSRYFVLQKMKNNEEKNGDHKKNIAIGYFQWQLRVLQMSVTMFVSFVFHFDLYTVVIFMLFRTWYLKVLWNANACWLVLIYNTLIITNVAKRLFKYVPYILL